VFVFVCSGQLLGHHKSSSGCDIMQLLIFDELIKDSSPITNKTKNNENKNKTNQNKITENKDKHKQQYNKALLDLFVIDIARYQP
jgi:hypothetical protein